MRCDLALQYAHFQFALLILLGIDLTNQAINLIQHFLQHHVHIANFCHRMLIAFIEAYAHISFRNLLETDFN